MIKGSVKWIAGILLIFVGILLVNTLRYKSLQKKSQAVSAPGLSPSALTHFQEAIRIKTISFQEQSKADSSPFTAFHQFIQEAYPLVHQKLLREVVSGESLLYTWKGIDDQLKPIVLMAHQDVVPVEEATLTKWSVDPFAGTIKDDFIWGRGTADDKINLVSILEAAEKLLGENFQPKRTVYFAFGHDEETGGSGARALASLLKSRGVNAGFVLDEGGIVTTYQVPGMTKPVALLGTSEKGYMSLELVAEINGGHSSQPAKETSIDILARAIQRIRDSPFEPRFSESTQTFIDHIGPEQSFLRRMVFANQWLFRGIIFRIYEESPGGNAMIRTTGVPTIIEAGVKDNVIPTMAKATINFRLLPGDGSQEVVNRVKDLIGDDRIRIDVNQGFRAEASSVTPVDSEGYKIIEEVTLQTFGDVVVTPFMMIGGTDSRHFGEVSSSIIKFSPMIDPIGYHGIDERVSLESYRLAIGFYRQLLSGQ